MQNVIDRARIQSNETTDKKYKTANKLVQNEEMTRAEARKAVRHVKDFLCGYSRASWNLLGK